MVGVLLLTHGPLAKELLAAAVVINGDSTAGVEALCLDWEIDFDEALEIVRRKSAAVAGDEGLLILTDMYGGTPHNVAKRLVQPGSVELVSGVNLPMVVRLLCRSRNHRPLPELVDWITAKGQRSICSATYVCD